MSERDLISLATFKADNKSNNKVLVTQNDFSFGKASWVLPYFSKDYIHELDEFQAIIISGGKGHVDERDDINYFFKALQKYMKTHQVVGFCMAYQYQLKK